MKAKSLATMLAGVVCAVFLPLLAFGIFASYESVETQRARILDFASHKNREIVRDLAATLTAHRVKLSALTTSLSIERGEYDRLREVSLRLAENEDIQFWSADGRLLMRTSTGPDVTIPAVVKEVLETRTSLVSSLRHNPARTTPVIDIALPVIRGTQMLGAMVMTISTDHFAEFLAGRDFKDGFFTSIVDTTGIIIARSARHRDFVGRRLPGMDSTTGDSGTWSGVNPQGVPVYAFFLREPSSRWIVTMGISRQVLEAPVAQMELRLAVIGVVLTALMAGLVYLLVRHIRMESSKLIGVAIALGDGRDAPIQQWQISDFQRIGDAMAKAAGTINTQAQALSETNRTLEDIVEQRTRELAATQARYEVLAENGADVIVFRNRDSVTSYVSPSITRLTGYNPEEIKSFSPEQKFHPDDGDRRAAVDATLTPERPTATNEFRMRHKDGHWVWVHANYTLIPGGTRDADQIIVVVRDISDRKRAEEALLRSNEVLRQFAAVVSHDLKAPARHLSIYSDLLQTSLEKSPADASGFAARIGTAAVRMQELIGSLAAYTQVAYARCAVAPVPLDSVVADVTKTFEGTIAELGARIETTPLPIIAGDRGLLESLFQNLIGNALKYHGADPVLIRISSSTQGSMTEISVTDNGIGVPAQHSERIFEIFKRLHPDQSKYLGTGIGLAMSRSIVETHGGRIWLDTSVTSGACFRLTLPVATAVNEALVA
ncbi:MAG: ATP-binding protein [Alphaproteobacteria bacterium]